MAKTKRPADSRQLEFYILFDAMPDVGMRDYRDGMERPLVSLAKQARHEPVTYNFGLSRSVSGRTRTSAGRACHARTIPTNSRLGSAPSAPAIH